MQDYGATFTHTKGRPDVSPYVDSYFFSHPAAFGFWPSLPPDNINLNSTYAKTD